MLEEMRRTIESDMEKSSTKHTLNSSGETIAATVEDK